MTLRSFVVTACMVLMLVPGLPGAPSSPGPAPAPATLVVPKEAQPGPAFSVEAATRAYLAQIPPAAPATQISMPLVLKAERGLFLSAKSDSAVVVFTLPEEATRPTVRFTVAAAVPAMPLVPTLAA